MQFDAFWPPRLAELGLIQRDLGAAGSLRFPRLDAPAIQSLCLELASRTNALRARPVTGIVDAIAHATHKLVEPGSDLFASALRLIPETTGYSVEMTAHVLRRMAQDWTAAALNRLIEAELGSAQMLDDFAANGPRHTHALGPALTAHVFSGNVPGVAVTSLIRALIVKSPSFGKTAADEPVLPVLFARALAKVDDHLADSLVITHWPGGSRELDAALAGQADTLIVYGGEDAVAAARANARHTTRLVLHGPKLSFGIVAANAAANQRTARHVACAVATFDQQGCVSPHLVYVIGSPEQAAAFAHLVHQQLQEIAAELPRGRLRPDEAIAQHNARASAEFRAISGADLQLLTDPVAGFTVVYDADPMFQLSCLNRFVYIKPLAGIGQLPGLLRPVSHHLQSVGVEGFSAKENAELANLLAQLGASRISSFAQLPWLPAEGHHDGNGPLRELLRFVDLET